MYKILTENENWAGIPNREAAMQLCQDLKKSGEKFTVLKWGKKVTLAGTFEAFSDITSRIVSQLEGAQKVNFIDHYFETHSNEILNRKLDLHERLRVS